MKLGAENKKKVAATAALVVIAILIGMRAVASLGSLSASTPAPAADSAKPAPAATPVARAQKKGAVLQVRENTLDPTLRTDILQASQKLEYAGGKRNIFRMEEPPPPVIPKPVAPVVVQNQPPPGPPPPPPPPPILLRFFGFASRPGEPKKIFLAEGSEVFVAKEGDIVNRRYRIVQINNNSVLVEDVLNNNRQTIQLTAAS